MPPAMGARASLLSKQMGPVCLTLCASLVGVWLCCPSMAAGLGFIAVGGLGVSAFCTECPFVLWLTLLAMMTGDIASARTRIFSCCDYSWLPKLARRCCVKSGRFATDGRVIHRSVVCLSHACVIALKAEVEQVRSQTVSITCLMVLHRRVVRLHQGKYRNACGLGLPE